MSGIFEVRFRSVKIPLNRQKPLKEKWDDIVKTRVKTSKPWSVDIRSTTKDDIKVQKGVDFLNAFVKGFDFVDCVSVVRMDGLYIRTIYIKDVARTIKGDHLTRAIGRVCGANGVMRKKLENATKCRIVVTDNVIHIMGTAQASDIAHRRLLALIRGAPVNKIAGKLGNIKMVLDNH